jgi:hypothetical protein
MALRVLQLGFEVTLIEVRRPDIGGVEIIPSRARHLLSELRLGEMLAAIRPGYGMGMLRWLGNSTAEFHDGRALYVDRLALRRAVMTEAVARGAGIQHLRELPKPDDGAFAFIDATGRRAGWSRPVTRYGRNRADVFSVPGLTDYDTAAVVGLEQGWCYAAADQAGTTIAVVHDGGLPRPHMERAIRRIFGIAQQTELVYLGRRPAFPQSAAAPLRGRVIAIGDAVFSHDPIGGRGLSFALGCAFAVGAVLQTWRDHPVRWQAASDYYKDFVAAEKCRHLTYLSRDEGLAGPPPLPSYVVWSAREAQAPLALPDGIDVAPVVLTQADTPVRWLGGIDVFEFRVLCDGVKPASSLIEALCRRGFTATEARAMIDWALRNRLLSAAASSASAEADAIPLA